MIPKCRIYCYETQEMIVARDYRELAELFLGLDADDGLYSEPMQSTGLFDKNGNEIFEDDIVKTTIFFGRADESGGFYEYEKELIGIVKQLEGTWVIDTEKGAVYLWSDIDENEVLGNIWDNLELLEDLE